MSNFQSPAEAKEYLVARIAEEAARETISLSDVEKEMLYFSEPQTNISNVDALNRAFELECDAEQYEQKVASLIRNYHSHIHKRDTAALALWNKAIATIRKQDHYLLVLIDLAKKTPPSTSFPAIPRRLKVIGWGLAAGCVALLLTFLLLKMTQR